MEDLAMTKVFLALGAAAVALSAAPAEAKHYTNLTKCVRYHHGRCVAWKRLTRGEARRAGYADQGHFFLPGMRIGHRRWPLKRTSNRP